MCGRFVIAKELGDISVLFEVDEIHEEFPVTNFNVAPTTNIPIIVEREIEGLPSREIHKSRWGLVPSWAKEIATAPLINARIESVLEKPSFKESAASKRCIIPVSGYYEWQTVGDTKDPYYIYPEYGMLALAGIYSWWRDPKKTADDPTRWLLTAALLTKESSPSLSFIHNRNPVFLSPDNADAWLAPDYQTTQELLLALSEESDELSTELSRHVVSKAVGAVANNSPDLIRAI